MTNSYATTVVEIVRKFNTMELPNIMSCFAADVVTNYNGMTIMGSKALAEFLNGRYADISDYTLEKTIFLEAGNIVGVKATARYTRKSTGERVIALIHEFLQFDGNLISHWDYVGHNLVQTRAPN